MGKAKFICEQTDFVEKNDSGFESHVFVTKCSYGEYIASMAATCSQEQYEKGMRPPQKDIEQFKAKCAASLYYQITRHNNNPSEKYGDWYAVAALAHTLNKKTLEEIRMNVEYQKN